MSLFFDGTGNNRVNIRNREQNTRTYWWMRRAVIGPTSSYDADFSNVVRLAENLEGDAAGYDAYLRVYTEGIGTTDDFTDSRRGGGTGTGSTGVEAKVTRGLQEAVHTLSERYKPTDVIIDRLSVDTSGFSRGAAAARHCVHRVLNGDSALSRVRLQVWLERLGYEVGQVEVRAVGLFDTVSSHGYTLKSYDDNVATLHLDAVRQAVAVYQLAAAEEYRERFSLTDISSAGGKGRQVYLPGAHSDVGGSYRDGEGEDKTLYDGSAALTVARFLVARGWYHAGRELHYRPGQDGTYTPYGGTTADIPPSVSATRAAIARAYTYIPLRCMGRWLGEQGVPVRSRLNSFFEPGAVPGRARIEAYADEHTRGGGTSKPSDWDENPDGTLRVLRHGYLHISFSTDIGMAVRLAKTGRPIRKVYPG